MLKLVKAWSESSGWWQTLLKTGNAPYRNWTDTFTSYKITRNNWQLSSLMYTCYAIAPRHWYNRKRFCHIPSWFAGCTSVRKGKDWLFTLFVSKWCSFFIKTSLMVNALSSQKINLKSTLQSIYLNINVDSLFHSFAFGSFISAQYPVCHRTVRKIGISHV